YKAHRVSDEPDPVAPEEALGRQLLAALGFAVAGARGFEAEDVIATLAARARGAVEVVSGDRDLFALVRDPDVRVLYPVTGVTKLLVVDEAEIRRRYGIPGRAYGDFALLRGDPSDGLPGVPGIGEKTAAALIARHSSLAAVLASRSLPPAVARRIDAARDYLAAARRVVPPVADVPLPRVSLALPARPAKPEVARRLAAEHRLGGPPVHDRTSGLLEGPRALRQTHRVASRSTKRERASRRGATESRIAGRTGNHHRMTKQRHIHTEGPGDGPARTFSTTPITRSVSRH